MVRQEAPDADRIPRLGAVMSYDPGGCIRTPFAVPKVVDASAGACAELALALGGLTVPFAFELNGVNGTERKRVSGTGYERS